MMGIGLAEMVIILVVLVALPGAVAVGALIYLLASKSKADENRRK